jgi:hypothetical protein
MKIKEGADPHKIKDVEFAKISVLSRAITLYPESLAYLFTLEGCAKKLFLYLLFIHADRQTGEVRFNDSIIDEFTEFCEIFGVVYKLDSIKQAIKELRDKNILLNIRKGMNLINPMITSKSDALRNSAIKSYCFEIVKEGNDPYDDFFPTYK